MRRVSAWGETFGRYRLLGELAQGGMAEVHYAVRLDDPALNLLAVKRALPALAENPDYRTYFETEMALARELRHPKLVQFVDCGLVGQVPFLALEYVHGRGLHRILKSLRAQRKRLPLPCAAYIAKEILEALDYVHQARDSAGRPLYVVQCDVSPSNILVSWEGEAKLIDFGIANSSLHALEQIGVLKGKKSYMAPEQLRGLPLDHRADIFSMGACLYELLTGESLFARDGGEFAIEEAVRTGSVRPLSKSVPGLPEGLDDVFLRAMAVDRDQRFSSAGEFAAELEPFARLGRGEPMTPQVFARILRSSVDELIREDDRRVEELLRKTPPQDPTQVGDEDRTPTVPEREDVSPAATRSATVPKPCDERAALVTRARQLEAMRQHAELIDVIRQQIALESSPERLAWFHARLASLLETAAGDEPGAIEHYRISLQLRPGFEASLQGLLALGEKLERWELLVEALHQRLAHEAHARDRATILTRLGELLAKRLGRPEDAVAHLERALEEAPESVDARIVLLELLCRRGEFARAEQLTLSAGRTSRIAPEQLTRLFQLQALLAREQGRCPDAMSSLVLALDVAADPAALLGELVELLSTSPVVMPVPAVLLRQTQAWLRAGRVGFAVQALQIRARLLWHSGDVEEAERVLLEAAGLGSERGRTAEALGDLYYACRRFPEALDAWRSAIGSEGDVRVEAVIKAAQLLSDHLERPEDALALLEDMQRAGVTSDALQRELAALVAYVAR